MGKKNPAEVLRLRATSCVTREIDTAGLTKNLNKLALMGLRRALSQHYADPSPPAPVFINSLSLAYTLLSAPKVH